MTININSDLSIFPILRTRRIVLDSQKVKIEALISSQESENSSSWLGSSDFLKYVKFYFILLSDNTADLATRFQDPQQRTRLSPESEPDISWDSRIPQNRIKQVSMMEVLQDNFNTTTPISDLDQGSINDIYFEAEITLENTDYDISNRWHLVAFSHIDMKEITQDYGLDPSIFAGMGGNMTYDLLLERDESGTLIVPTQVSAFFVEKRIQELDSFGNPVTSTRLVPYHGPYHYHDASNPGPDGYIGWMAGHVDGEMGDRLIKRDIAYEKVVAREFIDSGGFISSYNGYLDYQFSESNLSSIEDQSTGELLIDNLSSVVDFIEQGNLGRPRADRMREMSLASLKNSRPHFFDKNQLSFIRVEDPTGITNPDLDSYHGAVFFMKYLDIVRKNSPLGWILTAHRSSDKNYSKQITSEILERSRIIDLSVSRRRLTNSSVSNNEVATNDYQHYDGNEVPKHLVRSRQASRENNIRSETNRDAHISELNLELPLGPKLDHRTFLLKDYQLFRDINYGNYTYSFDLAIEDGIKAALKIRIDQLSMFFTKFSEYVSFSTIPVASQGLQTADVRGCFDFRKSEFTDYFRRKATSLYAGVVEDTYRAFVRLYIFLNTNMSDEKVVELESVLSSGLDPRSRSCTPESIDKFVATCSHLMKAAASMASSDGILEYHRAERMKMVTNLKSKKEVPIIRVHAETNLKAAAVRRTDVLYEPGLLGGQRPDIRLPTVRQTISRHHASSNIVLPARFFTLEAEDTAGNSTGFTEIINNVEFLSLPRQRKMTYTGLLMHNRFLDTPRPSPESQDLHSGYTPGVHPISNIVKMGSFSRMQSTLASLGAAKLSVNFSRVFSVSPTEASDADLSDNSRVNYVTREMENVLCNIADLAKTKEEYVDSVINLYKDITFIKKSLGSLYDELNAASMFVESYAKTKLERLEEARAFSNEDLILTEQPRVQPNVDVQNYLFESKALALKEVVPEMGKISTNEVNASFSSTKLVIFDSVLDADDGYSASQ